MQIVKDKNGQDWTLDLNVGTIVRIRAATDGRFDLYKPEKDNLASTLADDLPTFWELLWYLCEPEAKTRNITADQFGEAMADEVLVAAQTKFLREWSDFFHRLGKPAQHTITDTALKASIKALELVQAKLTPQVRMAMTAALDKKLTTTLNDSFGSLQDLLGFQTPDSAHSDSLLGPLERDKDTTGS